MNKYPLAISSSIIFFISFSVMGSVLPNCEKKAAAYVNYQELPQNLRTKAKKVRELQSQQKIFSQEERRKQCPQESAIAEDIFNKLVAASNLQNYVSGEQSLYPLVNCNNNDIDGYTLFGTVVISAGALRQENEGEIAFIIGHEIGHHLLAHDLKGSAASPTTEWAADRVGLSLMVNAGYDSDSALSFFNKLDPHGNKTHGKPAQRIENLTHCDY